MWEITGWVAAGCLSILCVAFTISVITALIKPKPRNKSTRIL